MNKSDIIVKFQDCITSLNKKLADMDYGTNVNIRSRFYNNPGVDDVKYYVDHFDTFGGQNYDYIKKLIIYGNNLIQKLQSIPFQSYTTRDEQIQAIRNMQAIINQIEFPKHENRSFRGVGRGMLYDPYGVLLTPSYNWDANVPKLVIERIKCHLDVFKSILDYKEEEQRMNDLEVLKSDDEINREEKPTNDVGIFESMTNFFGKGGKKKRRTNKKQTKKNKSRKQKNKSRKQKNKSRK